VVPWLAEATVLVIVAAATLMVVAAATLLSRRGDYLSLLRETLALLSELRRLRDAMQTQSEQVAALIDELRK
jgi:hypothetical protein